MRKMKKTKVLWLALSLPLFLTGCLGSRGLRAQEVKADLALRDMRSQIEEFKYQLNKYEVEIQMVESKADSHNTTLAQLRHDLSKLSQNDQDIIETTFASYNKKLERLVGLEQSLRNDVDQLKQQSGEILSSLAQFKEKIDQGESQLSDQKRYIEHLKSSLEAVMKVVQDVPSEDGIYYTVGPGDSLDRIADDNNTTVSTLKSLNQISGNVIVVGQKIRLK